MSIPRPKAARARKVSSAPVTSCPSGVDAAASSALSSASRRPKITSSAIVLSGIQSTRLEGSLPSAKPVPAEDAVSSAANGALPLSRRPSGSATRAAPAVLTLDSSSDVSVACASAARSTNSDARWSAARFSIVSRKSARSASASPPAWTSTTARIPSAVWPMTSISVDERVRAALGDLELDALVGLRRERRTALRGEIGHDRIRRRPVLDLGDDDRGRVRRVTVGRPCGERDLVAEPRLHLLAIVDPRPGEEVLDDLVDLLVERGIVLEARQAADEPAEVHLLAGGGLQVDVDVERAVGRCQRRGSVGGGREEEEVGGEEGGAGEADERDDGDDEPMHLVSARGGRRGRHPGAASSRRRSSSSSAASRRTA